MPRKPRFNLIDIPQHVIQRGNNRQPCFFRKSDYIRYLSDLKIASEKYDCKIHAYVLMTNHVHILVTPMTNHAVSEMMQSLGRRYVRYFNNTYNRTGTLWEGRFKSSLIDSERYLLICMRYIEMNPVRASMVNHPDEYPWSSYRSNTTNIPSALVSTHSIYNNLGTSCNQRHAAYKELFALHIDNDTLHDIRQTLNHEIVLGQASFKDKIKGISKRTVRLEKAGRPWR